MQETWNIRSVPHRRSRPGGERRGDRAPPANARLHHRDRARHHGARRRRPLACRAGAADRGRRHRARLRLRPPAGRRRHLRRVQRRPRPSRSSTAWTSASPRSGLVFESAGWLDRLRARTGTDGALAALAGGAVIEPAGTIRHAGYFFSLFRRAWRARLRNVPEVVLDVARRAAVPGRLRAAVRPPRAGSRRSATTTSCSTGPHAALDYCLRVAEAGGQCVFEPTVRARALESSRAASPTRPAVRAAAAPQARAT